jgi:hypothetical protein
MEPAKKSADLHKVWGAPDNSRLTAKQYSFRLPVHVAAKIAALCDLYPNKQKTEIVGDLLNAALEELIPNLPSGVGRLVDEISEGKVYEEIGDRARFRAFANKHFKELERELGTKSPAELYASPFQVFEPKDDE